MNNSGVTTLRVEAIEYVKELYPRLKPDDGVIERYRSSLALLPPIVVARGRILVDGYHRWQAHRREGAEDIAAIDLGNLSDTEIFNESIRRNASHGYQLSRSDKQTLAARLWRGVVHLSREERMSHLAALLSVSEPTIDRWTKEARTEEKREQQGKAWDMWLDCQSARQIAESVGVDHKTITQWCGELASNDGNSPPSSRQHFDVWNFQSADKDAGAQSYFGALPPQVVENLLWFYTEPGQTVVDLFAGSGTTVDVAKKMGRRVWASDIRGNHYSPHLPIHAHDATRGWPSSAPQKADLVILDPPYWKQAAGRYSDLTGEMAELALDHFYAAWEAVLKACADRAKRVAYIISPTQDADGTVVDHATDMLCAAWKQGYRVERRIIVPYQTQQATGQQVTWARENRRMLKLYRDLVVLSR